MALPSRVTSTGGNHYAAVTSTAIAAGNVVVWAGATRLCKVIVNTALTSAQAITFYDNATTNSGTVLFTTATAAAAATIYDLQIPCLNGITIASNASLAAGAIIVTFE